MDISRKTGPIFYFDFDHLLAIFQKSERNP